MFHKLVVTPKLTPFSFADLRQSALWNKPGGGICGRGAHGHLGVLSGRRQLPEPEAVPALSGQGLPPFQPALQITSRTSASPTVSCVFTGSATVPFSQNPLSWWNLEKNKAV